jgi:bromodomain and PHD finger-containing protein 1
MVCNDGDFADENLIVICSKCNVSVHQNCFGIQIVP